jgi:translation initiation factor 2B subunit (eIF-2B alpha/beta/delta family)
MDQEIVQNGIDDIKHDLVNGSRILATKALQCLHDAISHNGSDIDPYQIRQDLLEAGRNLSAARPSMAAPITSAVLRAIDGVWKEWAGQAVDVGSAAMLNRARAALKQQLDLRKHSSALMSTAFANWLRDLKPGADGTTRLLTLSASSSLRECLLFAIRSASDVDSTQTPRTIELRILESRPNCEGADFGVSLLDGLPHAHNVRVVIGPESHVCIFAKDVDAVLLGADRISDKGDVSNKTGSAAAAICAKTICPSATVVVLSETDKIAKPGQGVADEEEIGELNEVTAAWKAETVAKAQHAHAAGSLDVRNVYFEWVPRQFIDLYVTEEGKLDLHHIERFSQRINELEDNYFRAEFE